MTYPERHRTWMLGAAVSAGVTLRLLYAFLAQVEPWSDFESYVSIAHNIVRGVPIHTRLAPGYPFFLSGVYLLQGSIEAVWVAETRRVPVGRPVVEDHLVTLVESLIAKGHTVTGGGAAHRDDR